jgi:hypothetical protein
MHNCDTLILAEWCIPVAPHDLVMPEHAIAIDGGRIVDVLYTARPDQIRDVRVAGRQQVEDGQLAQIDEAEL